MAPAEHEAEVEAAPVLGRYQPSAGGVLGEGGWCVVRRAKDSLCGSHVALKTFRDQVRRDVGDEALGVRFTAEIAIFETLGLAPAGRPRTPSSRPTWRPTLDGPSAPDPRQLFVSLLDFSGPGPAMPGPSADGRFWSVLELAEESLEGSLKRRLKTRDYVGEACVREVASSLAAGLHRLQVHDLLHLDVKPANVMRFSDGRWKLIDLEGCVQAGTAVDSGCITPLYACPELARGALERGAQQASDVLSTPRMDIWSVGVVLLDMLAHAAALQETFAGFQCQALMDFDAVDDGSPLSGGKREWYEWLCDESSLKAEQHIGDVSSSSSQLLKSAKNLDSLFQGLLAKVPEQRLSITDFVAHPFLTTTALQAETAVDSELFSARCVEKPPSSAAASPPELGVAESVIATFRQFVTGGTMELKRFSSLMRAIDSSFAAQDLDLLLRVSGTCVKGSQIQYEDFLRWLFNSRSA